MENQDLGELVNIGEVAHNVGWNETSPRGESELGADDRNSPDNLLLLCRNCHKVIDAKDVEERYTVELLRKKKQEHEERIRFLTGIGADRSTSILRVVGPIRGGTPELSYGTVLEAVTAIGLFPKLLPGSTHAEFDLDLRAIPDSETPQHFSNCASYIDGLMGRVGDGVRRGEIGQVAVFGFARIPLLVHLGARLDDKYSAVLFQRHRVEGVNPWRWPEEPQSPAVTFEIEVVRKGEDPQLVSLLANISGTIDSAEIPEEYFEGHTVYVLKPAGSVTPNPNLLDSLDVLANFERKVRDFLALVEKDHGRINGINLFPALPVSAAVSMGRALMPHISPSWQVFDRDAQRRFFRALQVSKGGAF